MLTLDEERELLSEKEILSGERTPGASEIPSECDRVKNNAHEVSE
jgi:hypothetical protein